SAIIMNEVVREFGELIDDDVLAILFKLSALVVDFLDVALGTRRADNVGRIGHPMLEPVEPLAAHASRQHRGAPTAEDAGDRHAPATIVTRRGPNRAVTGRIEPPRDK